MSSSVFFRFKSHKEPSRVAFDGTGISVFELKREIITMNKLGDGTDFELVISSEDSNEVYDDDTSIIPRSTTVIARRLPPIKPGRGGAARYVSGKMPQNAKNVHRSEPLVAKRTSTTTGKGVNAMNGAQTEEERLAAMFKIGADQWAQQQQEMANATPVHRVGPNKAKPTNVPDHPPPPGYICYRCGEKGHWIQVCPTNDDPAYENRPRVKRTTGIPRSFLKTVEKPTAFANDGTIDDTKQPAGLMVNAEGEYVIAQPDKAAWDQYQAKAKVSAAAQEAAKQGSKDLQDRGLECSIDKHLFVDPTKTPCCQTTFCHDCITNALLENDLRCPGCSVENILIDDLIPDKEMIAKIRSYEEEKATVQARRGSSRSPSSENCKASKSPPANNPAKSAPSPKSEPTNSNPRKRLPESDLVNERTPRGPQEKCTETSTTNSNESITQRQAPVPTMGMPTNERMSHLNGNYITPQYLSAMAYPSTSNFMSMGMTMEPVMGMNPAFHNPSIMPHGSSMGNEWSMWGSGYQQQPISMQGNIFQNNMMPNGMYHHHNNLNGMNSTKMNGRAVNGQGRGSFANQQRTTFGTPSTNDEDSAYFRKPVNPHRHQARRNVQRPTDYREI